MFNDMCREDKIRNWDPCDIFASSPVPKKYAVMILNRPLPTNFKPSFILTLWQKAALRITVDGGTNCWLSWLRLNNQDQNKDIDPEIIVGDMDSITEETLEFFTKRNTNIHVTPTPDQNETDFTKALREIDKYIKSGNLKVDTVLVFGDTSGRIDQILANINTLFKAKEIVPDVNVLLLASTSLTWLLVENITHCINIPLHLREREEWCALIPIGSSCKATTTGLKWNLSNTLLEFGNLVSTSNTYNGDSFVSVQADRPLIWSMGIRSLL